MDCVKAVSSESFSNSKLMVTVNAASGAQPEDGHAVSSEPEATEAALKIQVASEAQVAEKKVYAPWKLVLQWPKQAVPATAPSGLAQLATKVKAPFGAMVDDGGHANRVQVAEEDQSEKPGLFARHCNVTELADSGVTREAVKPESHVTVCEPAVRLTTFVVSLSATLKSGHATATRTQTSRKKCTIKNQDEKGYRHTTRKSSLTCQRRCLHNAQKSLFHW